MTEWESGSLQLMKDDSSHYACKILPRLHMIKQTVYRSQWLVEMEGNDRVIVKETRLCEIERQ